MAERTLTVRIIGDASVLERNFNRAARSSANFERDLGKATRGALAGSGAFRSLGRSIAFASGGFLAFASAGDFLRKSFDAAKDARVVQAQLAAQFKASGQNLADYQEAIDRTADRLSLLSGFENDQLKQAFTTIFRTTGDVSKSLRDLATAADLARAKHLDLNQAALIIAKTEAGNTTLLRRQGFQIDKNAKSEKALAELRRAVAGQAEAGTTAQERFGAALHNTEEIIGSALLPTLNKYLNAGAKWLTQMNESGRLEKDVATATRDLGKAFEFTASAIGTASSAYKGFVQFANDSRSKGGLLGGLGEALRVLAVPGVGLKDAIALLKGAGIIPTHQATVRSQIKGGEQLFQSNLFGQPVIDTSGFNLQFFNKPTTTKASGSAAAAAASLSRLQQLQIALARNPNDVTALRAMAQFDREQIAALNRRFAAHKISTAKFTEQVTAFYGDLNQILSTIADVTKKAREKVKLPRLSGQFQFGFIPQKITGAFQLLQDSFATPLRLQLEAARATALGHDLTPILRREKAAILDALHSGRLAVQGQIDAWNAIAGINDQLGKTAVRDQTKFRHVAVSKLLEGVSGLSLEQRRALAGVYAQIGPGGVIPQPSMAFSGAGAIVVQAPDIYLDGKKVTASTTKRQRKAATRRVTARRGPWAGRT